MNTGSEDEAWIQRSRAAYFTQELALAEARMVKWERGLAWLGTWNVAGLAPTDESIKSLKDWLTPACSAELVVLTFQEVVPLNAAQLTKSSFWGETYAGSEYESQVIAWEQAVQSALGAEMDLIVTKRMLGVQLWIFCPRGRGPRSSSTIVVPTAGMGLVGTKGAVCASLLYVGWSCCVIGCHMPAGEGPEAAQQRKDCAAQIFQRCIFKSELNETSKIKGILDHAAVFWLGDFNSRIAPALDDEKIRLAAASCDSDCLVAFDELRKLQQSGSQPFASFDEAPICFHPSYKLVPGAKELEYSKKKSPAYCDRVLYKADGVQVADYQIEMHACSSDHKPVSLVLDGQFPMNLDEDQHKELVADVQRRCGTAEVENGLYPKIDVDREMSLHGPSYSQPMRIMDARPPQLALLPIGFEITSARPEGSGLFVSGSYQASGVIMAKGEIPVRGKVDIPISAKNSTMIQGSHNEVLVVHAIGGGDIFVFVNVDQSVSDVSSEHD